jgi:hypothetical protein
MHNTVSRAQFCILKRRAALWCRPARHLALLPLTLMAHRVGGRAIGIGSSRPQARTPCRPPTVDPNCRRRAACDRRRNERRRLYLDSGVVRHALRCRSFQGSDCFVGIDAETADRAVSFVKLEQKLDVPKVLRWLVDPQHFHATPRVGSQLCWTEPGTGYPQQRQRMPFAPNLSRLFHCPSSDRLNHRRGIKVAFDIAP